MSKQNCYYKIIFLLLLLFGTSCQSADKNVIAQKETTQAEIRPSISLEGTPSFSTTIGSSDSAILQFGSDYEQALADFAAESTSGSPFAYALYDIDKDSTKELITRHFTGGVNCCDEHSIFQKMPAGNYREIFTYPERIAIQGNVITLSAYERLGNFYTCYTCLPPDERAAPQVNLLFDKGQFYFVQNKAKNDSIVKYLSFLQKRNIPAINADDISAADAGERKGYAWNLFAWYYNNFRDKAGTEALFTKYYSNADKAEVWQSLLEIIEQTDEDLAKYNIKLLR